VSYHRTTSSLVGFLLTFGVLLTLIIGAPFVGLWCINTLFNVNNPYDFMHWVAMFLSCFFVFGSGKVERTSKR